jgi:hypothetical protein
VVEDSRQERILHGRFRGTNVKLHLSLLYSHSDKNREIIWPVFREVIQTLVLGVSEVEHYFSYTGQKLELPPDLDDKRYVYLRNCVNAGE